MSATSPLATYMDVREAARGGAATSTGSEPELATRAKVLAAVRDGAELVREISEHAGVETAETLTALAWLSQSGLVELQEPDGEHWKLTDAAQKALQAD